MSHCKADWANIGFARSEVRVMERVLRQSMKKCRTSMVEQDILRPVIKELSRATEKMDVIKNREKLKKE